MVQPTNRRFVMEDRLDAELATLNTAIDTKVTGPVDNAEIADGAVTSSKIADGTIVEGDLADGAVTSAKILNGTIVDADVNASAAIAYTKVTRPPLSNASDVTLTSPTLGQALTYNGTGWVNSTPVNSLSGLSDVTITSPVGGEVVKYNALTSKWVNGAAAGGVTAAAAAPDLATAAAGDAWFDTNDGTLYVCYVDPDSTKQWVQVQANSALEGSILARLGALESQTVAFGTLSPNYIINGAFDFWQRGTSISTSGGLMYTTDRWQFNQTISAAMTISQQLSGLTGIKYCARIQRNSGVTALPGVFFTSSLETSNSVAFAGKNATLSFYARAGANMSNTTLQANLYSGTGTDQSVAVGYTGAATVVSGSAVLTTSWQRFSYTGAVSSSATELGVSIVSGYAGTAGANDWFEITGVQLEVGSTATAFRRNAPSIQAELAACQRYYEKSYNLNVAPLTNTTDGLFTFYGTSDVASNAVVPVRFAVPKRTAAYTLTTYTTLASGQMGYQRSGASSSAASVLYRQNENMFHVYCNVGVAYSACSVDFHWTCSAEL